MSYNLINIFISINLLMRNVIARSTVIFFKEQFKEPLKNLFKLLVSSCYINKGCKYSM